MARASPMTVSAERVRPTQITDVPCPCRNRVSVPCMFEPSAYAMGCIWTRPILAAFRAVHWGEKAGEMKQIYWRFLLLYNLTFWRIYRFDRKHNQRSTLMRWSNWCKVIELPKWVLRLTSLHPKTQAVKLQHVEWNRSTPNLCHRAGRSSRREHIVNSELLYRSAFYLRFVLPGNLLAAGWIRSPYLGRQKDFRHGYDTCKAFDLSSVYKTFLWNIQLKTSVIILW